MKTFKHKDPDSLYLTATELLDSQMNTATGISEMERFRRYIEAAQEAHERAERERRRWIDLYIRGDWRSAS